MCINTDTYIIIYDMDAIISKYLTVDNAWLDNLQFY